MLARIDLADGAAQDVLLACAVPTDARVRWPLFLLPAPFQSSYRLYVTCIFLHGTRLLKRAEPSKSRLRVLLLMFKS